MRKKVLFWTFFAVLIILNSVFKNFNLVIPQAMLFGFVAIFCAKYFFGTD